MGSSPSKPTKKPSSKNHSKPPISRPTPQHTPLSYPSLSPLPFRPLPHHPAIPRPTPEQELAARVAHFISTKPEPAYHGGARGRREEAPAGQHYRLLKGANTQFLGQPRPSGQVVSAVGERKQEKKKTPYQFRPLDEIGAPRVRAGGKKKHDGNGYGLYPAAEKGDKRERGGGLQRQQQAQKPSTRAAKGKPGAKYGGTRQDRHGEWWVLVLADGRWHRMREMGLAPPV